MKPTNIRHYFTKIQGEISHLIFDNKISNLHIIFAEKARNWSKTIIYIARFTYIRNNKKSKSFFGSFGKTCNLKIVIEKQNF